MYKHSVIPVINRIFTTYFMRIIYFAVFFTITYQIYTRYVDFVKKAMLMKKNCVLIRLCNQYSFHFT